MRGKLKMQVRQTWNPKKIGYYGFLLGSFYLGCIFSLTAEAALNCDRVRQGLYKLICGDQELFSLDQQVWDTYASRLQGLGLWQAEELRRRHRHWRSERGLYDKDIISLKEEYRQHLRWLEHIFLPIEGYYTRGDGASISLVVLTSAGQKNHRVSVQGQQGAWLWNTQISADDLQGNLPWTEGITDPPTSWTKLRFRVLPHIASGSPFSSSACQGFFNIEDGLIEYQVPPTCPIPLGGYYTLVLPEFSPR